MTFKGRFPFSADIKEILDFKSDEGQINLGQERVVLMSQHALGILLDLMMTQLGPTISRMILAQFGYNHGLSDYDALGQMFEWQSDEERLNAGPLMHAWNGIVRVEPTCLEIDRSKGHFYFRGKWHNSYEAAIYRQRYGISERPVCYTLAGYGSGWCTAFFGGRLLEIEKRCVAQGDPFCEWEIKPWDEWGTEANPWKESLMSTTQSLYMDLLESHNKILKLNDDLENEVARRTEENRKLLRMICHDLTVPTMAIRDSIGIIKNANQEKNPQKVCDILEKSTNAIQSMLEQVRQAEGRLTGKIPEDPRSFALYESVSMLTLMFSHQLKSKNVDLVFDDRLGTNDLIWAPFIAFTTNILSNILSNALKFSPKNGKIYVISSREGQNIKIIVRDQGIGIPARLRPHLFSNHVPTSRLGTAGEVGTGFGLPIVKSYVDALGGRMDIFSKTRDEDPLDHGTTVVLYVPAAN